MFIRRDHYIHHDRSLRMEAASDSRESGGGVGFGGSASCERRSGSGRNGRCLVRRECLPVADSDENCIRGRRNISRENTICCKGRDFGSGGSSGSEGRGAWCWLLMLKAVVWCWGDLKTFYD